MKTFNQLRFAAAWRRGVSFWPCNQILFTISTARQTDEKQFRVY
jgi:hypothetical protein